MKTFETEKHNIPEGATHYSDESDTDVFAWFKSELGINYLWCPGIKGEEYWISLVDQREMYGEDVKPIPQTKEVEWENGDECRYSHDVEHEYVYVGEHPHGGGHYVFSEEKGITYIANGYLLKPETEAERVEREREDAINEMSLIVESGNGFAGNAYKKYCASLYDAGYRKESE